MSHQIRTNRVLVLMLCVAATVARGDSLLGRESPVTGIGHFAHGVADIHEALAFYRDVLGLELVGTRPPLVDGKMAPNVYDARLQAVMDVGGAYYRFASFRIPGAEFRLQLVEMINNQRIVGLRGRRQSSAMLTERGAVALSLIVADANGLFTRIRDGFHGDLLGITPGPGVTRIDRFAFRDDPDGFPIEVVQAPAVSQAPTVRNDHGIRRAGVVLTAANYDDKVRFYRDLLGFEFRQSGWEPDPTNASAGSEAAAVRRSVGLVPGTSVPFEIREYRGVMSRRFYPSTMGQDGVGWVQFIVRDLDALMRVFVAERVLVVSTGLQPVAVDEDSTRHVVIRDPDGVFVELIERGEAGRTP
jgi:catechol 2,3-dioxygenase-like lactoylglutathione lyase family enzyme